MSLSSYLDDSSSSQSFRLRALMLDLLRTEESFHQNTKSFRIASKFPEFLQTREIMESKRIKLTEDHYECTDLLTPVLIICEYLLWGPRKIIFDRCGDTLRKLTDKKRDKYQNEIRKF